MVHNGDMWLETRAIDSHRANSRLLKKALQLENKDYVSTVLHVNASTITDTYWVKPIASELTYIDVKFDTNYFLTLSTLALKGTYDSFNRAAKSKHFKTPELTNIGSFEKCWKLNKDKWWMYKVANQNERFSELFAYELGTELGMLMAYYEQGKGYIRQGVGFIKSLDFTDGASVNFESALSFMGDNDNYVDTVKTLQGICPKAIPAYIQMIFLDAIIANPDRHTSNFGLLRDVDTGKLLELAPVFDHNMAVISRGYPSKANKNDILIAQFNDLLNKYPENKKYIPVLTEGTVRKVIDKLNMSVKTQSIVDLVMDRYELINKV